MLCSQLISPLHHMQMDQIPPRLQQTEEGTKSRGYEAAATNTVVLDQGVYFIII